MAITRLNPLFKSFSEWIIHSTEKLGGEIYVIDQQIPANMRVEDTCILLHANLEQLKKISAQSGSAVVVHELDPIWDHLVDWVVSDQQAFRELVGKRCEHRMGSAVQNWSYSSFAREAQNTSQKSKPALFLDRDGVVVEDVPYLHKIEELKLKVGIKELIEKYKKQNHIVLVASNQSGLGRGMFYMADYLSLTQELSKQLNHSTDDILMSPFFEDTKIIDFAVGPQFRKPRTGMIHWLQRKWGIDLGRSLFVGDTASDMLAAEAAGIAHRYFVRGARVQEQEKLEVSGIACKQVQSLVEIK